MTTQIAGWSYVVVSYEESPQPKDLLWSPPCVLWRTKEEAKAVAEANDRADCSEDGNPFAPFVWEEQEDGSAVATRGSEAGQEDCGSNWVRVFPLRFLS